MTKVRMSIVIFGSLLFIVGVVGQAKTNPTFLNGKIYYIDAGHGGVDPGTVVDKIYEKDINLKISLLLKDKLIRNGAKVYLTREGDYDLGTPKATYRKKSDFDHRIKLINDSNADYYISIHLNYLDNSKYYGPQVFYNNKFTENKDIANVIQTTLNEKLNTDKEIKKIPQTTYMYSKLNKKGILIECGFLSNYEERNNLLDDNYLNKFTDYLIEALVKIENT